MDDLDQAIERAWQHYCRMSEGNNELGKREAYRQYLRLVSAQEQEMLTSD